MKRARVLLVDDHPVVRDGLRSNLVDEPTVEVVGEAASGEEALALVAALQPDVVLMDVRLPGLSGLEATRLLADTHPEVRVVMLTIFDEPAYFAEALRSGARGYLLKNSSPELILWAILAAAQGCAVVPASLLQGVAAQAPAPGPRGGAEQLTQREMEVLRLLADGCGNKAIAARLGLAEPTVKKYMQSVIGKLGVSDRTQAATLAVRLGLVD